MKSLFVAVTALAIGMGVPDRLTAQSRWDTLQTPSGPCAVWRLPSGSPTFPDDASYSRCALDRPPTLLAGQPMPPQPLVNRQARAEIFIVVRPDGSVDPKLTQPRIGTVDSIFDRQVFETVRAWRFQPGMRGGTPVRSAFEVVFTSDDRVDTLPARLEWTISRGRDADTVVGTWHHDPVPAPFTVNEADSIYMAMLRRLLYMQVVVPYLDQPYCLVLERSDSIEYRRFATLASRAVRPDHLRAWIAPPECERSLHFNRLVFPRIHRTENGRAVLQPTGDLLPNWPPGLNGATWRAWSARCIVQLPTSGSASAECSVSPLGSMRANRSRIEDPEWYGRRWMARARGGTDESVRVRVLVTTRDAFQTDTFTTVIDRLPRLDERAVFDTARTCSGAAVHGSDGSREQYVVQGDARGRTLFVSRVMDRPVPTAPAVAPPCNPQATAFSPYTAFVLGEFGEPVTEPLTLCMARCARSYVLDPSRHTLADRPHVRFRLSELRDRTRDGGVVRFRILVDPPPENLFPLVIVRMGDGSRPQVSGAVPVGPNAWDYRILRNAGYPPETEFLIYLARW